MEIEAPLGLGIGEAKLLLEEVLETQVSAGTSLSVETSLSWTASSEGGTGTTLTRVSGLDLDARVEPVDHIAHPSLGARWLPDDIGMALVQSQTADVFALRLGAHRRAGGVPDAAGPRHPQGLERDHVPHRPARRQTGHPRRQRRPGARHRLPERVDLQLRRQLLQTDRGPPAQTADRTPATAEGDPVRPVRRRPGRPDYPDEQRDPGADSTNLVNSYVWTADGGTFAETNDAMDSMSESVGGSFSFATMLGANVTADIMFATVALTLDVTAQIGAHLELEMTKTRESRTSFGVTVQLSPERDIDGPSGPQPGKVDAYRLLRFYLAPDTGHYNAYFNTVVDPIWLASSSSPSATALRGARQPAKRPACWRMLHRVTYVSRVLAPVGPSTDPVTAALRELDLSSNYELIQSLRPYLIGHTATAGELGATARHVIAERLPELIPHADQIVVRGHFASCGRCWVRTNVSDAGQIHRPPTNPRLTRPNASTTAYEGPYRAQISVHNRRPPAPVGHSNHTTKESFNPPPSHPRTLAPARGHREDTPGETRPGNLL